MLQFKSQSQNDGYNYTLSLPDGWSSGTESDGEKDFVVHRSPAGARLIITFTKSMKVNANVRIQRDIAEPLQRTAYAAAVVEESYGSATNAVTWLVRGILKLTGRRPQISGETLGELSGFTYWIHRRSERIWCGYFVHDPWIVHVRFVPAEADYEQQVSAARDILRTWGI